MLGLTLREEFRGKRLHAAQGKGRYRLKTPTRDGTADVVFEALDKIAGSDFEQPQAGPQGEGQDARRTSLPGWQHWYRRISSVLDASALLAYLH